jgi:hypothetical protein
MSNALLLGYKLLNAIKTAFHWETLGFSQSLALESEEKMTADRAMLLKQSDRNDDKNVASEIR